MWIALLIIAKVPIPALGTVWPAIVVGVTVFFLVIVASADLLSCVPANVYGYAALVGYTLSAGKLDALTAGDNSNPLLLIVISAILGAVLGYLMAQLAGVLKTRSAARSSSSGLGSSQQAASLPRVVIPKRSARHDVGKLKIEFVFWHAAGTIRAGRSSRVAHINEHSKCRSGAIAALAAVLRYRVLSARKLPRGASKHHSQCDKSEKATLIDDHRSQLYRCCGFAAQPTLSGISPRTLYLFACRRTNNMIRPRP